VTIEEQTVAGACLEFIVVNFAKEKMTLRVPTRGLREGAKLDRRVASPVTANHGFSRTRCPQ
jgi:CarD family transcriptional regulator